TVKTPVGVAWPGLPVLTVEIPMRMPLRYTYASWSVKLTTTTIGPEGTRLPCQRNSPGASEAGSVPGGFASLEPQNGTFARAAETTRNVSTSPFQAALRGATNVGTSCTGLYSSGQGGTRCPPRGRPTAARPARSSTR